jgi:hypothetical protein
MTEKTETPEELARKVLVAASRFAAAVTKDHYKEYPNQVGFLPYDGFAVKVSAILSMQPRVALVNVVGDEDHELGHVLLKRPAPLDARKFN